MSSLIHASDVEYFGTGVRNRWPSNFALVDGGILIDGRLWPSTEHFFQAWHKVAAQDRHRLEVGGDLDSLQALKLLFGPEVGAKKMKKWTFKDGQGEAVVCVGIVAKMLTKKKHNDMLTKPLKLETREVALEEHKAVWTMILMAKVDACPPFRKALQASGNKMLVEFDRHAKAKSARGSPPFWTGMVKDGVLYGHNFMGSLMMEIRAVM